MGNLVISRLDINEWRLEDRAAAMLGTVIYTSDHIDLVRIVDAPDPAAASDMRQLQRVLARMESMQDLDRARESLRNPAAPQNPNLAADRTSERIAAYPQHKFVYHTVELLTNLTPEQKESAISVSRDISEQDFDTVATVVLNNTLFAAFNYKLRSTRRIGNEFEIIYRSFGQLSAEAIGNVMRILRSELDDVNRQVDRVNFIGLRTAPFTPQENAAPHAEMQICLIFRS